MENLSTYIFSVFIGFFAIMNPVANIPVFLGLVDGKSQVTKKKIAKKSTITAFIIVAAFTILGKYIFDLFGLTIPAFKITGGILIFFIGFEMLMSKKSQIKNTGKEADTDNIAISPLAIPLLAGPGTIVTAMNFVTNATYFHIGIVLLVFAVMILLTYIAFILSEGIVEKLGSNVISVIGKLMGLILAIIGTGLVIDGIKMAFNLH